jgi:hypothetical protein
MAATWTESSQMTIAELADFSASLQTTVSATPETEKLRPALHDALSAECVQCGIRLSGEDILNFPAVENEPRYERLRAGYCARAGCDARFYRVTCAPHPHLNWPVLLSPAQDLTAQREADEFHSEKRAASRQWQKKNILRLGLIVGVLLVVLLMRHIQMGGTIPFVREPENFRVDKNPNLDGR